MAAKHGARSWLSGRGRQDADVLRALKGGFAGDPRAINWLRQAEGMAQADIDGAGLLALVVALAWLTDQLRLHLAPVISLTSPPARS